MQRKKKHFTNIKLIFKYSFTIAFQTDRIHFLEILITYILHKNVCKQIKI